MKWKELKVPSVSADPTGYLKAVRLNSLGSLFFFAKEVLGKRRLTTLHQHLCHSLEAEDLHLVLEVSMGFFKTTLSTALSVWWAIPFLPEDETEMRALGYKKEWLRYMRAIHNPNTRTLYAHEIDKRAVDIGKDVDYIYFENDLYRELFPSILPDRDCEWNDHSKYQKRSRDLPMDPTNPTFAYCGVGHALQGVHPDSTIEDDVFGKAAQYSMLKGDGRIRDDTVRWHQQLTTRLDTSFGTDKHLGRQLVTANRWGHMDLNSWIEQNQPHFKFERHSAEGGCCKVHPAGKSIFPEEWPWERLKQREQDLGRYDYCHFYLNQTTMPEEHVFDSSWLRKYTFAKSRPDLADDDRRNSLLIQHKVYDGEVLRDFQAGVLDIVILVDPNHNKKTKRTKHVILTIGIDPESERIYLLHIWEDDCTYSILVDQLYKVHGNWTKHNSITGFKEPPICMGALAFRLLSFYLDQREKTRLPIIQFDDDDSLAAIKNRVESLEPIIKNKQVWCHPSQTAFIEAVANYPACDLNVLDVLGHFPQLFKVTRKESDGFLQKQLAAFTNRRSGIGGY